MLLSTLRHLLPQIVESIFIANFSYEVVSAPIHAGISLMAMSHAAGLHTKTRHIGKGLQFTVPVILRLVQFNAARYRWGCYYRFFLSTFHWLSAIQSLICDKKVPPMQSLLLSLRAVRENLHRCIYLSISDAWCLSSLLMYGIGLIFRFTILLPRERHSLPRNVWY